MTPNDPPVCKLCKTNSKMILHGTEWVCHGTHALDPFPNERPTPLTDAACGFHDIDTAVDADFARTLEQMLPERTEERDRAIEKQSWLIAHPIAIEAAHQVVKWTKCEQERDIALAKLAKCREALARLEEVGILCQRAEEARYSDARIFARQTLEETK